MLRDIAVAIFAALSMLYAATSARQQNTAIGVTTLLGSVLFALLAIRTAKGA